MMSFYQIWNTFDNITFIDEMRAHNFALAFRSVQDQKYWKYEHITISNTFWLYKQLVRNAWFLHYYKLFGIRSC